MQYLSGRRVISLSVLSSSKPRRGAVAVFDALILGTLSVALATAAGEWYVDINAPNCSSGTGTQTSPFCNIMDAVDVASSGDTVHIAPGTYFENLILDKDLTLIGTGGQQVTIVDGDQAGSVVTLAEGTTVDLTGLTVTNGLNGCGGGIFVGKHEIPAALTLTSSTVSGNKASGESHAAER